MARMIPSIGPADATTASREEDIYDSLSLLPDEYTVIHSFRMIDKDARGAITQREADFVIFHKNLGILCIEAKAGRIHCVDGEWFYQNGTRIKHGGPYQQADSAKWKLLRRFEDQGLYDLSKRCRANHAVWLPSIDENQLSAITRGPEALRDITLCRNDLRDPKPSIDRIMNIGKQAHPTRLTDLEAKEVLDKVLLPSFDIVPSHRASYDYIEFSFIRLLKSQARVLDFLQDQKSAVINGAAGTGKTLIAIEHAKRCAKTDKVLFLCFNKMLRDDIAERCRDTLNIDVFTIAKYACRATGASTPDYQILADQLMAHEDDFPYDHIISRDTLNIDVFTIAKYACRATGASTPDYQILADQLMAHEDDFPYDHIIIDEGQDFGIAAIEDAMLLDVFKHLIDIREGGTMYFFYDCRQFVQGSTIPGFIAEADSKLTLYVNCRNTRKIACSSLNSLHGRDRQNLSLKTEDGNTPQLFLSTDPERLARLIDEQITDLRDMGLRDIVILTCKTVETSTLRAYFTEDGARWHPGSPAVHTVRKFKGLEADAIILVDVDENLWKQPEHPYDLTEDGARWHPGSPAVHTVRKFKGLEADAIILVDVDENLWKQPEHPYDPDPGIIFYTAASRARHELRIMAQMDEAACARALEYMGVAPTRRPKLKFKNTLNLELIE